MCKGVWVVPVAKRPEFHVPLASSGDTNLDNNDMMTPSKALRNTKIIIEPHTYWVELTVGTVEEVDKNVDKIPKASC